ncbi:hypothetical protein LXL04_025461 [Taraxacum kok-saghyz]
MPSNFFKTVDGTLKIENRYDPRDPSTDLQRVSLPPCEMVLAFQDDNFLRFLKFTKPVAHRFPVEPVRPPLQNVILDAIRNASRKARNDRLFNKKISQPAKTFDYIRGETYSWWKFRARKGCPTWEDWCSDPTDRICQLVMMDKSVVCFFKERITSSYPTEKSNVPASKISGSATTGTAMLIICHQNNPIQIDTKTTNNFSNKSTFMGSKASIVDFEPQSLGTWFLKSCMASFAFTSANWDIAISNVAFKELMASDSLS